MHSTLSNPLRLGLRQERVISPQCLVIFGASGDGDLGRAEKRERDEDAETQGEDESRARGERRVVRMERVGVVVRCDEHRDHGDVF